MTMTNQPTTTAQVMTTHDAEGDKPERKSQRDSSRKEAMKKQRKERSRIRQVSCEEVFKPVGKAQSFDLVPPSADVPSDGNGAVMITDSIGDVCERYNIDPDEIGCGHYGIVRECRDRRTGETYAIKSIPKSEEEGKKKGKKPSKIEAMKREVEILGDVSHRGIIRHFGTYEDDAYLHLVTEMCTGGMLFDRIVERDEPHPEREAARLVASILDAVAYLHDEKNIVHRDIKPENFLFATDAADAPLKLIDFGLSRSDPLTVPMRTSIGTAYYVAPEVLDKRYNKLCDLWSVGVVAYMILCGYYPFYGDTTDRIVRHVKSGEFDFPAREWDSISSHGKDFVRCLLRADARERPTAAEALRHKWILKQTGGGASKKKSASARLRASFKRSSLSGFGGGRGKAKAASQKADLSRSVH